MMINEYHSTIMYFYSILLICCVVSISSQGSSYLEYHL